LRQRKWWIISDTHWFHYKTSEWCGRPENFTELTIKNLRQKVCAQDILIHLGDVIFKNQDQLKGIMDSIPGVKILTKGNHDKETDSWYSARGFHVVCDQIVIKNILFSHKPLRIPEEIDWNCFGHFHNSDHRRHEPHFQAILEPRHKLFALEYSNYEPIDLQRFITKGYEK